jgi:hypothetical protein
MVRASVFKACVHAPMTEWMEEALNPRDAQLARRIRTGGRLLFYSFAALMLFAGWHFLHDSKPANLGARWSGSTSQGQPIHAWIDRTGTLTHVDTHILQSCSDGSRITMHWRPAQQRFVQHGQDVRGYHAESVATESGKPDMGETNFAAKLGANPSGRLQAGDAMTTDHGTVLCNSGPVTFTLSRAAG